ncbi:hypothetical protein PHMEG_00024153 [Phytophthora megakarya]|uniref:RxLR effector protein n=1 Tax=Phytophthora megakarya TaxID=4795 RepID=A0A225VFE3_9STRA|nr:hypothetical protein PHMEG_00024153 [Phytophthora megakarya]
MRLSYMLLVVLTIQLVNTAAALQTQLSTQANNLSARYLRTAGKSADYYDAGLKNAGQDADEERVASATTLTKVLGNKKIIGVSKFKAKKTVTFIDFSKSNLVEMLKNPKHRLQEFAMWDKAGVAFYDIQKHVSSPTLRGYYLDYLDMGAKYLAKFRRVHPS